MAEKICEGEDMKINTNLINKYICYGYWGFGTDEHARSYQAFLHIDVLIDSFTNSK